MQPLIALLLLALPCQLAVAVDWQLLDHPHTRPAVCDNDVGGILGFEYPQLYTAILKDEMAFIQGTVSARDGATVHISIPPGFDLRPFLAAELIVYHAGPPMTFRAKVGNLVITKVGFAGTVIGEVHSPIEVGDQVQGRKPIP
jgi:hypothetical protein